MITVRFTGWISGRIVTLQPERISKNCFQTGTGYGSRYPKRFYRYFEDQSFRTCCTWYNHSLIIFRSILSYR